MVGFRVGSGVIRLFQAALGSGLCVQSFAERAADIAGHWKSRHLLPSVAGRNKYGWRSQIFRRRLVQTTGFFITASRADSGSSICVNDQLVE